MLDKQITQIITAKKIFTLRNVRVVQEGVLFGWRTDTDDLLKARELAQRSHKLDLRLPGAHSWGLYFTEDQQKIISLAIGNLHYWTEDKDDYELMCFEWPDALKPDDVCCHPTHEKAEKCAIGALITGLWCRPDHYGE